jgi:precorrin-6B methylase 2
MISIPGSIVVRVFEAISIKMIAFVLAVLFTFPIKAYSQDLDVAYVETPEEVIPVMLTMAQVGRGDYVIDLGTGDGRIVIAAVKLGAVGLGVDLDPQRVRAAKENAEKAGVSDRVMFLEQDLFETDLSHASVVTMYLNSAVNLRLRPTLLEKLEPGTRIVSHNFDMEDWLPDEHQQFLRNADGNFYIHDVYYWVIPADVRGEWQGNAGTGRFQMTAAQDFQSIEVEVTIDDRSLVIEEASLNGDRINIVGHDKQDESQYVFSGSIEQKEISGIVRKHTADAELVVDWRAERGQ